MFWDKIFNNSYLVSILTQQNKAAMVVGYEIPNRIFSLHGHKQH